MKKFLNSSFLGICVVTSVASTASSLSSAENVAKSAVSSAAGVEESAKSMASSVSSEDAFEEGLMLISETEKSMICFLDDVEDLLSSDFEETARERFRLKMERLAENNLVVVKSIESVDERLTEMKKREFYELGYKVGKRLDSYAQKKLSRFFPSNGLQISGLRYAYKDPNIPAEYRNQFKFISEVIDDVGKKYM